MKLSAYKQEIRLYEAFVPATGNPHVALNDVVDALKHDSLSARFLERYAVPQSVEERRRWVQAALTVRSPGNLPSNLLDATDRLLQHELSKKTVTDSEALQRLGGGSNVSGRISIWDGDTTTLRVDAITNAANSELLGCFQPFHACIDNVINCAAGPQLREDCHRIMQLQGHGEVTGVAKITRAYNLPSRYVLHTVGPIVQSGSRLTTRQETQLADCYQSCLSLASEAGARSVALCGISTGVFGYPAQAAAKIALATVIDWVGRNPNGLSHVIFNTFGDAATRIYEQEARQWELL